MKITVCQDEIYSLFGGDMNIEAALTISGVKYYIWEWYKEYVDAGFYQCGSYNFHLTVKDYPPPKPKSSDVIAAEEAVKKAEESLKAAKETLSKIKEK